MFSNSLICSILEYINSNINKEITIEELSNIFFFNKTYIMKKFKKEIGITIFDYINSMRIYNSLGYYFSDYSIMYIGFSNGFNSLEYYSETFKKIMEVSPRTYKKYINKNINLELDDLDKILTNTNKIKNIKDFTTNYINRKPPVEKMVKSLVFK